MILIRLFNEITEFHLITPAWVQQFTCQLYAKFTSPISARKKLLYTSFHKPELLLALTVTVSTHLMSQLVSFLGEILTSKPTPYSDSISTKFVLTWIGKRVLDFLAKYFLEVSVICLGKASSFTLCYYSFAIDSILSQYLFIWRGKKYYFLLTPNEC